MVAVNLLNSVVVVTAEMEMVVLYLLNTRRLTRQNTGEGLLLLFFFPAAANIFIHQDS